MALYIKEMITLGNYCVHSATYKRTLKKTFKIVFKASNILSKLVTFHNKDTFLLEGKRK